jgi:hypothetical protein
VVARRPRSAVPTWVPLVGTNHQGSVASLAPAHSRWRVCFGAGKVAFLETPAGRGGGLAIVPGHQLQGSRRRRLAAGLPPGSRRGSIHTSVRVSQGADGRDGSLGRRVPDRAAAQMTYRCRLSSNPAARRPSARVRADCSIRREAAVSTCGPARRPNRACRARLGRVGSAVELNSRRGDAQAVLCGGNALHRGQRVTRV